MKRQTIWKTSVSATTESEDAVTELLAALVAPGPSTYTDADTGVITVSAYSTKPPKNIVATKSALRRALGELESSGVDTGPARISIIKLPAENWADSWKRHFPPLEIGNALLVKPSWSRRKPRKGQAVVVLDPGLSFGTGQHPTTSFCLREIVRASREEPPSFLDMGTGSGILAIAAAKLGYAPVHAFDFDPQCVRVANANARANRVQNKIRISHADLTKLPRRSAKRYDVVCANLLSNLLISERDRILARVKPGGILVVAGILNREFKEVQHAYESAGTHMVASRVEKEWRSGAFQIER
ncbi:MAG: 50S ribosomal protein L11 methyltransferase [Verrucomicrobia bacterium]|nr:50S ribosomal protein L11 methyltransferase [Verrucomicrobiota bacterium]